MKHYQAGNQARLIFIGGDINEACVAAIRRNEMHGLDAKCAWR